MNIGERYARLVCIGKDTNKDYRYYLFQCDCGNIKSIIADNVKNGLTKSCGCLKREKPNHLTFGFSHTRIDNIYKTMIARCHNPNCAGFKWYGAKGIIVCEDWKNDKVKFFEWAFANGYKENLTLDRIDNSLGYSPQNCRWATYKEQANNKTTNRIVVYKGENYTLSQFADKYGLNYKNLWQSLKRGKTLDEIICIRSRYG